MSHFGLKINKTECPDKTPYTVYYPHTIATNERKWNQDYYQVVSIDPARKNYAMRIEKRFHSGVVTPVVFDKVSIESFQQEGDTLINNTYQMLTNFLDKYQEFYDDCHFIIIERQLPQNYKATRIGQHSISYFSLKLHNKPLLPSIIEVDPKLKGKILGAPKGINDKQLKTWAVEVARKLLLERNDMFSLDVLKYFKNKQDDLSDTICQIEALFTCWNLIGIITEEMHKNFVYSAALPTYTNNKRFSFISDSQSESKKLTGLFEITEKQKEIVSQKPFNLITLKIDSHNIDRAKSQSIPIKFSSLESLENSSDDVSLSTSDVPIKVRSESLRKPGSLQGVRSSINLLLDSSGESEKITNVKQEVVSKEILIQPKILKIEPKILKIEPKILKIEPKILKIKPIV